MADRYLWNAAAGSGTGADWTNAHTNLTAAITASASGDRFFVAHDHVENLGAATTFTFKGTLANPDQIICANRAGSVPPVSADLRATAAISTTTSFTLTLTGTFYCSGVIFSCGSGANSVNFVIGSTANNRQIFENCSLRLGGTTGGQLQVGPASGAADIAFINTTFQVAATGGVISLRGCDFEWRNTPSAISGATLPTTLLQLVSTKSASLIEGVDLSALGAGKALFATLVVNAKAVFKDCRLGASVGVAGAITVAQTTVDLIRCDSGDTNYRQERYVFEGVLTTETTIVRTGGASDGTTPISWKIVTTASPKWFAPFKCFPLVIWNETVGSAITLTVECIASAVLNNDDIWFDVEYLGTSGFPQGNFATSGKTDILATGAANPTSTETWGGALTGKFKLSKAITPQEKGPITVYVRVAKASQTVYVDPKITVT